MDEPPIVWITIIGERATDVIFDGTPEQFADCFFSNVDRASIKDFCLDQGYRYHLEIHLEPADA